MANHLELTSHGSLVRVEFKLGGVSVVLLSTYWPVDSRSSTGDRSGSLWVKMAVEDPIRLLKGCILAAVCEAVATDSRVILSGDFNSDFSSNKADTFKLAEFLSELPVTNSSRVPEAATFLYRRNGEIKGSCIDHVFTGGSNIES